MRRPKPGDLVAVRWDDIEHLKNWATFDDVIADRHCVYRAAGWVVRSAGRFLVLAPVTSSQEGGSSSCAYRIPWGAVRRWRRLR